jgi:hypothetical protein
MAMDELGVGVMDTVVAELVECTPPEPQTVQELPESPDATPTAQSQDATIEQTGSGPPPDGESR